MAVMDNAPMTHVGLTVNGEPCPAEVRGELTGRRVRDLPITPSKLLSSA
jgi:hypothetical protein